MNTIRGVNCEGLPSRRKRHARERLFSAAFHRTRIPFVLLVLVVPPRPANFPSIFVPSFDSNFDTPRHHLKSHRSSRKFRFSRTPFPLFPQRRHVHFQFIGTKRRYLSSHRSSSSSIVRFKPGNFKISWSTPRLSCLSSTEKEQAGKR